MDDLISRQAAIDAIKDFKQGAAEWKDEQEEGSDIWHRADSAIGSALEIGLRIKKLPSAQPEIIRCEDCRWWEDISSNTFAPEYHMCKRHVMTMTGMDFCSRAERRTNG